MLQIITVTSKVYVNSIELLRTQCLLFNQIKNCSHCVKRKKYSIHQKQNSYSGSYLKIINLDPNLVTGIVVSSLLAAAK